MGYIRGTYRFASFSRLMEAMSRLTIKKTVKSRMMIRSKICDCGCGEKQRSHGLQLNKDAIQQKRPNTCMFFHLFYGERKAVAILEQWSKTVLFTLQREFLSIVGD